MTDYADLIARIPDGFTAGPWRVRENRGHNPEVCDLTVCGDIFALADVNGPNYAHCESNAALIALAPELAAAVRTLTAERPSFIAALAALAAAISLLERSPKTAAPSDQMFDIMLADYKKALAGGRAAFTTGATHD